MRQKKGTIRAKGKCPICGNPFVEIPKVGFACLEHKTTPKRVYLDLWWEGKRIRIFTTKAGDVLETWGQADSLRDAITQEIKLHAFDPATYIKAEAQKFYASTLLERFEKDKYQAIAPSYRPTCKYMVSIAKNYFKIKDVRELRKIDIINYVDHLRKSFT